MSKLDKAISLLESWPVEKKCSGNFINFDGCRCAVGVWLGDEVQTGDNLYDTGKIVEVLEEKVGFSFSIKELERIFFLNDSAEDFEKVINYLRGLDK